MRRGSESLFSHSPDPTTFSSLFFFCSSSDLPLFFDFSLSSSFLFLFFLIYFLNFSNSSYATHLLWFYLNEGLIFGFSSERRRWICLGEFFSFMEYPFKHLNVSCFCFFFYSFVVHSSADMQIRLCFPENLKKKRT